MGAAAHRCEPPTGRSLRLASPTLAFEASLCGRFVRRYKRFFADIETDEGRTLTVHCANPGSMLGFHRPGAQVRCSTSDNPKRKLRHTLEMMRVGRIWVGLNTLRANAVVERALEAGTLSTLAHYTEITREVVVEQGSRLDFALRARRTRTAYMEVKSVTLAERGTALFPDSVTERGLRHLEVLTRLRRARKRALLCFLVQRADCERVAPADAIDPAYGQALRRAARAGVELLAFGARVSSRGIRVERALPVVL